jgi:hypothetical protein
MIQSIVTIVTMQGFWPAALAVIISVTAVAVVITDVYYTIKGD